MLHEWLPVVVVTVPAFLALMGTIATVVYTQKSTVKKTVEEQATEVLKLGMTTYIERLQQSHDACEERSDRQDEEIQKQREEIAGLRTEKNHLENRVEDLEANVIALKRKIGELP